MPSIKRIPHVRKRKRDVEDDRSSADENSSDEDKDIDPDIDISKSGQQKSKLSASRKMYLSYVRAKAVKHLRKYACINISYIYIF